MRSRAVFRFGMARDHRETTEPEADVQDAQPGGPRIARLGRTWDRILEAAGEIDAGTPAERALRAVFKKARDLGSRERTEVSEVVYGLIRNRRAIDDRLDRALKAEGKKREVLEPPMVLRLRALTYLALQGAKAEQLIEQDPYANKRVPRLLPRLTAARLPGVKRTPLEALAVRCSLPDFMVERLASRLGIASTERIAEALKTRAPLTIRVNTLVTDRESVRAGLARDHGVEATPTPHAPLGLMLPEHMDISSWPLFLEGAIEVQDEGSQLLALATGAAARESVLDACAGAGGKTLALAAMMSNTGRLVALEPDKRKLEELKKRARRAGITNLEAVEGTLDDLPAKLVDAFDRVLVDAPCTGSGAFRRHPDARWRITEQELVAHAENQMRLLAGAAGAVKPGGVLAYATCSVFAEEDEDVVDSALQKDSRLDPLPIETTLGTLARTLGAEGERLRIGPGPTETDPDGFFVALMRRRPR